MFQKSESIVEISKALIAFHKEVPAIEKKADNPFFKSKYATGEEIIATVDPILVKHGLTFAQFPSDSHGLVTILMHTSGEWMLSEYYMSPVKDDPQGVGSAITYQKRYALAAVLGLKLVGEDDDGNAASGNTSAPGVVNTAPRTAAPAANYRGGEKISEAQRKYLFQLLRHAGKTKEGFEKVLLRDHKIVGIENMPKKLASDVIDFMVKKYGQPQRQAASPESPEDLPEVQLDEEDVSAEIPFDKINEKPAAKKTTRK